MAAAYECDWCAKYFKQTQGFKGGWKKTVMIGKREFQVDLKVSGLPHLCPRCFPKFCKGFYDDLRATYKSVNE